MKKLAFFLAVILALVSVFPCLISAETEVEGAYPAYIVSSEDSVQGDKVTVRIGIRDNPGIIALRCRIYFDEDSLELISVKDAKLLNEWNEPAPEKTSPYALYWEDALTIENNDANGVIAELVFKVKNNAKVGQTEIRAEHVEALSADGMDLLFIDFDNGSAMLNITAKSGFSLSSESITLICSIVSAIVVIAVIVLIVLIRKKRRTAK